MRRKYESPRIYAKTYKAPDLLALINAFTTGKYQQTIKWAYRVLTYRGATQC